MTDLGRNERRLHHLLRRGLWERIQIRVWHVLINLTRSAHRWLSIRAAMGAITTTAIRTRMRAIELIPLELALNTFAIRSVTNEGKDGPDAFDELQESS